jgi:hypothetical protein
LKIERENAKRVRMQRERERERERKQRETEKKNRERKKEMREIVRVCDSGRQTQSKERHWSRLGP